MHVFSLTTTYNITMFLFDLNVQCELKKAKEKKEYNMQPKGITGRQPTIHPSSNKKTQK